MHITGYVTVVLPLHQGACVVMRALEAIAAQTYRPLEIVVVDDGSTDPGPAWVRAFRRQHPEIPVHVVTQPRQGTGAALAAGLARARGEFVAFAHQADVWAPDKLARQVADLQGRPGAACSLGAVAEVVGDRRTLLRAPRPGVGLLSEPVPLSALVARRAAVEAAGGVDPMPGIASAHDLAVRLAAIGPCVRLPDEVAACHRKAAQATPVDELEATLTKLSAQGRLSAWQVRRGQSRLHARAGWEALLADDPEGATRAFARALRALPLRPDAWAGLAASLTEQGLQRAGVWPTPAEVTR